MEFSKGTIGITMNLTFQLFSEDMKEALDAIQYAKINHGSCTPLKSMSVCISPKFLDMYSNSFIHILYSVSAKKQMVYTRNNWGSFYGTYHQLLNVILMEQLEQYIIEYLAQLIQYLIEYFMEYFTIETNWIELLYKVN